MEVGPQPIDEVGQVAGLPLHARFVVPKLRFDGWWRGFSDNGWSDRRPGPGLSQAFPIIINRHSTAVASPVAFMTPHRVVVMSFRTPGAGNVVACMPSLKGAHPIAPLVVAAPAVRDVAIVPIASVHRLQ